MKISKQIGIVMLGLMAVLGCGCNGNSYSNQLKEEKKLINQWLERNNIQVINELPDDSHIWGEKEYYQVSGFDNMYFHLNHHGDSLRINEKGEQESTEIQPGDKIILRYKRFALTANADTANYWTTQNSSDPETFLYRRADQEGMSTTCKGWHEAVGLMKYPGAECVLICPSKQGFTADNTSVTPYGYVMKIKVLQ